MAKADNSKADDKAAEDTKAAPIKKTGWIFFRENIEAILLAVIWALTIRHFTLEAFEIPTGSMAPALYGYHTATECPNCTASQAVRVSTGRASGVPDVQYHANMFVREGECKGCKVHFKAAVGNPNASLACPYCKESSRYEASEFKKLPAVFMYSTICRMCTFDYLDVMEPEEVLNGHKIIVNKFAYHAGEPERWDVIVFKYNEMRNYIKRLVGLPGETIEIIEGDIFINQEIERKPANAQAEFWYPVFDSAFVEKGYADKAAWAGSSAWTAQKDGSFDIQAQGEQASFRYQRSIRNLIAYNFGADSRNPVLSGHRQGVRAKDLISGRLSRSMVRDLRFSGEIELLKGNGAFMVDIINGPLSFRLHLDAQAESWIGVRHGDNKSETAKLQKLEGLKLLSGVKQLIDFAVADRQLLLSIDGEEIARLPLPTEFSGVTHGNSYNTIELVADKIGAKLHSVKIHRDQHYNSSVRNGLNAAVDGAYKISEDGYFAMGDNTNSSEDSRVWGALSESNMLGRALLIFWPAVPRWEIGFIR